MSFLENLHREFTSAFQQHAYIGLSANSNMLEKKSKKEIRLLKVFQIARQQIENSLHEYASKCVKDPANIVSQLHHLKEDGERYYKRYNHATKKWGRSFCKKFYRILNFVLPTCFPNCIEQAEKNTKQAYDDYHLSLENNIKKFSKLKSDNSKETKVDDPLPQKKSLKNEDDDPSRKNSLKNEDDHPPKRNFPKKVEDPKIEKTPLKNKEDDQPKKAVLDSTGKEAPSTIPPSKKVISKPTISIEEKEKQRQKAIDNHKLTIQNQLVLLDQFDQRPISLYRYKRILITLVASIQNILILDPMRAQKLLKETGLTKEKIELLSNHDFLQALENDNQKTLDFLKPTDWHASFNKAIDVNQQGYIQFGIRYLGTETLYSFANKLGVLVKENDLQTYRGGFVLSVHSQEQAKNTLTELSKFLKEHKACRLCEIEVQFHSDTSLTPDLFNLLFSLKDDVFEIKLLGLESINFKQTAFTAQQEYQLIQNLNLFTCPDLKQVILSDYSKATWSSHDFSQLLFMCPQIEILKEGYRFCSSPCDIKIPDQLRDISEIDLSEFPIAHIPFLVKQFNNLSHLNLKGLNITDANLKEWIENSHLIKLNTLNLEGCLSLTTDSLFSLTFLSDLTQLTLPDLPLGKSMLNGLRNFDNPFKINLFYTSSKVTQPLASRLYTGPHIWSSIFQIPLSRNQVNEIFPPQHRVLDSKSVAYWFYNKDYQNLTPQKHIKTMLAESNPFIDDKGLIEFMKKFPCVEHLSLYNCPYVTDEGIRQLLLDYPHIRTIDLTGCPQITNYLIFILSASNLTHIDKIILSGTQITSNKLHAFDFNGKIVFEEMILTITDNDLQDEQALERLLKKRTLNNLKRINLTDCKKLTNSMLGQLLDHFNLDIWTSSAQDKFNSQRLNAAVINLTGCHQITNAAFEQRVGDKDVKLLEGLQRIVIGGTGITSDLQRVYSTVIFQQQDEPITIQIDPEAQLLACGAYYDKKLMSERNPFVQKELKKMAHTLIHHRTVVHLFLQDCKDQSTIDKIKSDPIETTGVEFCDITLSFQTAENAKPTIFPTYQDMLMCSQSPKFIQDLRVGGIFSKSSDIDCINQHANPRVAEVVMDLIAGKDDVILNLDWKTAAQVAELIGPENFNLSTTYYNKLLKRIHSQFDLNQADDMLLSAMMLGDEAGFKQYENTLSLLIDQLIPLDTEENIDQFEQISLIAKAYSKKLNTLLTKVKDIEEQLSIKLAHSLQ